jgi:hypothetical protein
MGKPNSHQSLEPLGMNLHPKVEYNILPKHIIEESIPDIQLRGYTADFFERPLGKPKGESMPKVGRTRPNKLE